MGGRLTLVRGLPGSGKTTFAKTLGGVLVEADDYFMVGGEYLFDHGVLQDAHKWCLWRTLAAMNAGMDVVVANTFTRYWEMKEYLRVVPNTKVYRCTGNFINVHNVPEEAISRMSERFESLQGEIFV